MKKHILARLGFCGLALHFAVTGQKAWADDAAPKTDAEKIGYALGMNIGSNVKKMQEQLKTAGVDLDVTNLLKGLKDTIGGSTALTTNDVRTILAELSEKMEAVQWKTQVAQAKVDADQAAAANGEVAKTLKAGQDFLDKNKSQAGVVTLPDGLQYKILKPGNGPMPKLTDTVSVNYRGTLIDGTEFDASQPDAPVSFPLLRVIPGWTEVLQLMPTGSKWQVFIPTELSYGAHPTTPKIAPDAALIFDVELVTIAPSR